MKVILTQDVAKLGSLGDEVEVKSGYARNYLIPQGHAVLLTRDNKKHIEHQRALLAKKRADAIAAAKDLAAKLADTEIVFTMKSGENGKLFGSVTLKHILDALAEQQIDVDRKKIQFSAPLKSLGTHTIPVKLHTEVSGAIEVKIAAEASSSPAAPAAEGVSEEEEE